MTVMTVGAAIIQIHIPAAHSLKDKRRPLQSLLKRLQREFNIAVAECGLHDVWQSAEIALVAVSHARAPVESQLRRSVQWIENHYPDLDVVAIELEWR